MTYNILDGGLSYGGRLEALIDIIDAARPDVLALNECNHFEADGGRLVYRLERELGMRGLLSTARTGYHVALFVRDLKLIEVHPLREPFFHAAIRAKVQLANRELHVMAAHLCPFSGEDRVREAQHLAGQAREEHVVIMGDLNSISPDDAAAGFLPNMKPFRRSRHQLPGSDELDTRAVAALKSAGLVDLFRKADPKASGGTIPTPLTDESARPELRIDYIFGTAAVASALERCTVIVDEATQAASDHFPLVADIAL